MTKTRNFLLSLDSYDDHDEYNDFRNMLIDTDDPKTLAPLINAKCDDTESITEIALSLSLCPLHRIDYAICFDDNDAECAQIRLIHPNHDS
jgi:hypothetical protein